MRRATLQMLVTAALLAACTGPAEPPPPPRPPVAPRPVQVAAFLRTDATEPQKDAVAEAMRAEPGASGVRLVTGEEAYATFKRMFADRPDLVESVDPESIPGYVVVTLPDETAAAAAAARFRGLAGVQDVRVTPGATPSASPT